MLGLIKHLLVDVLGVGALLTLGSLSLAVVSIEDRDLARVLLERVVVAIAVHVVVGQVAILDGLQSDPFLLTLRLQLLELLLAEDLLESQHLKAEVAGLPNAFDKDAAFVSGLPILEGIVVKAADVAQFVHISGHNGRDEHVHLPALKQVHFLVTLKLEVVQMVVVEVDLVTQVIDLALLNLNERVSTVEAESLVAALVAVSVYADVLDLARSSALLESQALRALVVVLHGRFLVLLEPLNEETPRVGVGCHPIAHERHALGHLDYPVDQDLHPLEVPLVGDDNVKEKLQVARNHVPV